MSEKIKLGISSCLLGKEVRYNGNHARDLLVLETFAPYVDFIDICPEVECGMPVPRESIHLVGDVENPRLLSTKSRKDFTKQMQGWTKCRLDELEQENLCGFIFKKSSPSCGRHRVRVYQESGRQPLSSGIGMFARAFNERFPLIPVEEEGRLHDPALREHFIERVFIMQRWLKLLEQPASRNNLIEFHTRHKLIFLAHSQERYRALGRFVAKISQLEIEKAYSEYSKHFVNALELKTTPRKHVNVLMHMLGYFKKQLNREEKQEMLTLIEKFGRELIPLIVPITMFKHYILKYGQSYLKGQYYVDPHPLELKLRNHC
ncbi:MAG: DUF1722 domain-containing protein [Deltaproteobacteria bacterium]|nr:DUF1722 domain-containing protein [Deltaproteobacteria bacterium]